MTETYPSRWDETRAMLTDLLTWLDATQEWVETTVSSTDAHPGLDRLDSDTEHEASDSPAQSKPKLETKTAARPDLFALLAAMTALRQEVTLQTRSARSDREQAAQTLEQLSSAVAEMTQRSQDDTPEAGHVGVDALVALHDALSRAERQGRLLLMETVSTLREWGRHAQPEEGTARAGIASDRSEPDVRRASQFPEPQPRGWFKRRRRDPTRSPAQAVIPRPDPEAVQRGAILHQIGCDAEQMANRLEGLSAGSELGLQRLERLLAECSIEPIECMGQPVNADLMEVVQLVTDPSYPDGTVVDEVRRGYRRNGQVYRFAQVVAARLPSPKAGTPRTEDSTTQQEVDGCRSNRS